MTRHHLPVPLNPGRSGPDKPQPSRWQHRVRALVAGLLSLLLVATAVAPASALLLHDGKQNGGGLLVTNWYSQGSHRDKWFGGWERNMFAASSTSLPGSGGNYGLAYCIEMGTTAGQIPADGWRQDTSENAKRLAWIVHNYGGSANTNIAAAVSVAAYRYAYPGKSQVNSVEWNRLEAQFFATGAPNKAIGDLATQYWNQSAAHANLNPPTIQVTFPDTNYSRARVSGIGIQNSAGTWLAGYPYTITLTGGTFSNGTNTFTGTTNDTPFVRDVFLNSGVNRVDAKITFNDVAPAGLWLGEHPTLQDSVTTMGPRSYIADDWATYPDSEAFRPAVVTRAVSEVMVGQRLTDSVDFTFTHDNGGDWPVDQVAGTEVPVDFAYAIYGPFATRPAQGAVPAGAPVFQGWTNYTRTTGAANNVQFTSANPVTTPGYYTWVWRVNSRSTQPAVTQDTLPNPYSWNSGILHAETTLASTPTVTTAAVPAVVHGTAITDTATITGLVAAGTQIEFELWRQGAGDLTTDELVTTTARQVVPTQSAGGTGTVTSPAVGQVIYGAAGTFYWRERLLNGTTVLHYGAPRLPGETTLVSGVSTTALAHANHGDNIYDIAHVEGNVPAGSHLVFELWRQGDGDLDTDQLVTTTEPVEVDGPGDYLSPLVGVEEYGEPGKFYWVEHLFTPADPDIPFTSGEPRLANETTLVSRVSSTALPHTKHGQDIFDVAHVEGDVPAESHLVFELWRQGAGEVDTDELVTTTDPVAVDGPGDYTSPPVGVEVYGEAETYYWIEHLYTQENAEVPFSSGVARLPAETTEVWSVSTLASGPHHTVGDQVWDVATVTGNPPLGSQLMFELWYQGARDSDTDKLVTTVGALNVSGPGEYQSPEVGTSGFEPGTYYWREVLSVAGEVLHYGAARVAAETFELSEPPDIPDVPDPPDIPELPRTGFNPDPTTLLGGMLLAGGTGMLALGRALNTPPTGRRATR